MGWGHGYKCSNCGKSGDIYCDFGMAYPEDCEDVYEKAKKGDLGDAWKNCVVEYPRGAFDCVQEVYKCSKCGFWKNDSRKNYYISTNAKGLRQKYVTYRDGLQIRCIKRFRHECPRCSSVMHRIKLEEESLNCVDCGHPIEIDLHKFTWD